MKLRSALFGLLLTAFSLLAFSLSAADEGPPGEPDESAIRATLQAYLDGSTYNDIELLRSAFFADARLFLSHPEREIYIVSIEQYAAFFADREKGVSNGRQGEILSIDRSGDIATAKAEIRSTTNEARYIDLFLLKKIEGKWKIISKSATRTS